MKQLNLLSASGIYILVWWDRGQRQELRVWAKDAPAAIKWLRKWAPICVTTTVTARKEDA